MNRDWVDKDFYEILGVSSEATADEIKKAYRKLAQKHHPDANPDNADAEEKFKEISEAYATLSNAEQRKEYDQVRRMVETGQRADGQFKVLRLTSDTSFAAEFTAERDLIGTERTKA